MSAFPSGLVSGVMLAKLAASVLREIPVVASALRAEEFCIPFWLSIEAEEAGTCKCGHVGDMCCTQSVPLILDPLQ